MRLVHKGLLLVAVLLALEISFLFLLALQLNQTEIEIVQQSHSRGLISQLHSLRKSLFEASEAMMGYQATKNQLFGERLEEALRQIPEELRYLHLLTLDGADSQSALARLDNAVLKGLKLLRESKGIIDNTPTYAGIHTPDLKKNIVDTIREMATASDPLLLNAKLPSRVDFTRLQSSAHVRLLQILLAGVILNFVIAFALVALFARGITRRLQILIDNSVRFASGAALHEQISGNDEISNLDKVFHEMAVSLRAAAQRKQEFVAMVTHDIRSPLGSVSGTLTLLDAGAYGTLTQEATAKVQEAERSTQELIELINRLLEIEKLEAGMLQLELADVSLLALCQQAVNSMRDTAARKDVSIQLPPEDLVIRADRERLTSALINLLSNAIRFSPSGSMVIITTCTMPGWLEVRVTDYGPGIAEHSLATVFERFKQSVPSHAHSKRGAGLGLPICKAIIQEHGGTIGVHSKEGEGCTFWFRLPLQA